MNTSSVLRTIAAFAVAALALTGCSVNADSGDDTLDAVVLSSVSVTADTPVGLVHEQSTIDGFGNASITRECEPATAGVAGLVLKVKVRTDARTWVKGDVGTSYAAHPGAELLTLIDEETLAKAGALQQTAGQPLAGTLTLSQFAAFFPGHDNSMAEALAAGRRDCSGY